MSCLNRPIKIIVDSAGHLAVCGRADGWDVVIDGMLWQTAGKSACYAGEEVFPEPLHAVWQHLPF